MEHRKRKNRKTKRIASIVVTGALATAMLLGGAYAWVNYSQTAQNKFVGTASNQVLLHDDFDGENKDVYVENIGDSPVYVRVKLAEYLQIGNYSQLTSFAANTDAADTLKGNVEDKTTWAIHTWGTAADTACTNTAQACHQYYIWQLGSADAASQKYYLSGVTENDAQGYGGITENDFNTLKVGEAVNVGNVVTYKRQAALPSAPMLLTDYLTELSKPKADQDKALLNTPRWLLDTDGWAYWSEPLQPGTATNLLLDAVSRTDTLRPADNWAYLIDVQLQAATQTQLSTWHRDNIEDQTDPNYPNNLVASPDNSVMTATDNGKQLFAYWTKAKEPSTLAPGNNWYKGTLGAGEITAIHFVTQLPDTLGANAEYWDGSADGDDSIPCALNGTEVYISANGAQKITANADASYMFSLRSDIEQTEPDGSTTVISGTRLASISGLNLLDTTQVTNMSGMFSSCTELTQLDLSGFNTENATNMSYMFSNCLGLTQLDVRSFNTANATTMDYMFQACTNLQMLDLSSFNTEKVTSMGAMFQHCEELTEVNLSSFDVRNVSDFKNMFLNCTKLKTLDLNHFVTSSAETIWGMFSHCTSLTTLKIDNFDTSNLTDILWQVFKNCSALKELNLSSFKLAEDTVFISFLDGCTSLETLNLCTWDAADVEDYLGTSFFENCGNSTNHMEVIVSSEAMKTLVENLVTDAGFNHITVTVQNP